MRAIVRVIGGSLKRRRLIPPSPESSIRPTSDRLRQTCFDLLMHTSALPDSLLKNATVLDAFAGTGAWGLEALSRGARRAIFFDTAPDALSLVRENATQFGVESRCCIEWVDTTCPPAATAAADVVFLDPPYRQGLLEKGLLALKQKGWLGEGTCVVAEYQRNDNITWPSFFHMLTQRHQGKGCLAIGLVHSDTHQGGGSRADV